MEFCGFPSTKPSSQYTRNPPHIDFNNDILIIWEFIQEWDDLTDYFPDLDDSKLPERNFMIGILSTLREEEMRQLIKYQNQ